LIRIPYEELEITQVWDLEDCARSLLSGVDQKEHWCRADSVILYKYATNEELEGLPAEAKLGKRNIEC